MLQQQRLVRRDAGWERWGWGHPRAHDKPPSSVNELIGPEITVSWANGGWWIIMRRERPHECVRACVWLSIRSVCEEWCSLMIQGERRGSLKEKFIQKADRRPELWLTSSWWCYRMTLFKVGQKQQIRSFRSMINQPIIFIFHSDLVNAKDKYPRNLLTSQDRKQLFSAIKKRKLGEKNFIFGTLDLEFFLEKWLK